MTRWRTADWSFAGVYGFAHFGKSLFWQSSEILFIFFLTEICAIPARQAGLVLGSALAFSAAADLVVAKGAARWIATAAAAARLQLVGTVLCAVALLLFAGTGGAAPDHRLAFALVASLLFRAAYALVDVPQNAMLGLVAADARQRTRLSAARFVASGCAALAVSGLAALLIRGVTAKGADGALLGGLVIGLDLLAVFSSALLLTVAGSRDTAGAVPPRAASFRVSLGLAPVPWLLVMGFALAATAPVFSKLEPYFATYVLGSATAGGLMLAAGALGGIVSQWLWTALAHRVSRRRVMEIAASLMAVGAAAFYAGAPQGAAWAVFGALLVGAGLGGLGMATWAALADATASAADGVAGRASAGAVFGAFTFASKLGLALSAVAVSELLAAQPYREISPGGSWPLLPLMCLAPIIGAAAYLAVARRL